MGKTTLRLLSYFKSKYLLTFMNFKYVYTIKIKLKFVCLNALISETTSRIWKIIFVFDRPILKEGHY